MAGPLEAALGYRNPDVVRRFRKLFDLSARDANALFRETRRWLWLCARSVVPGSPRLAIYPHMLAIDEMWHNFALFTRAYREFCEEYLGGFVDHHPAAGGSQTRTRRGVHHERAVAQAQFIRDELGEPVLRRWYVEFPRRFGASVLDRLRRPLGAG